MCVCIHMYICIYIIVRNGGGTHDATVSRRRASCGRLWIMAGEDCRGQKTIMPVVL